MRFLKSFFSRDGRRMLCLYEAPDAEAVRIAESQAKVPYECAWTCTNLRTDQPFNEASDGEYVVAESLFSEKITPEFVKLCSSAITVVPRTSPGRVCRELPEKRRPPNGLHFSSARRRSRSTGESARGHALHGNLDCKRERTG